MNRMIILSVLLTLIAAKTNLRNTDKSYGGDPNDYQKSVEQYLNDYGYPFEKHFAQTKDGYILTLWRIPCKNSGNEKCTPVLFQHGILDTGFSFLFQDIEKNLPIMLYHQNYDIWLGNIRGNRESLNHTHYDPFNYSGPFWEFSYDEMAKYDLPAMITYIKSYTKMKSIKYICHSQGCIMITALGALDPKFVKESVTGIVAFAPAVYMHHQHSIVFILAKWIKIMSAYFRSGLKTFMIGDEWYVFVKYAGYYFPKLIIHVFYCLVGAVDKPSVDYARAPVIAAHLPGGTSIYDMAHFVQATKTNIFQLYDFGKEGNIKKYGQTTPPAYNMENWKSIPAKWRIVFGEKDAFIPEAGIMDLVNYIKNGDNVEIQKIPDASHLDCYFADYTSKLVFPKVIEFIKSTDK